MDNNTNSSGINSAGPVGQRSMMATPKNPFGYFKPTEAMLPVIQGIRDAYTALHKCLLALPALRERSIAVTELETSAMWAIKGLVLHDQGSTQPEESGVTGAVCGMGMPTQPQQQADQNSLKDESELKEFNK